MSKKLKPIQRKIEVNGKKQKYISALSTFELFDGYFWHLRATREFGGTEVTYTISRNGNWLGSRHDSGTGFRIEKAYLPLADGFKERIPTFENWDQPCYYEKYVGKTVYRGTWCPNNRRANIEITKSEIIELLTVNQNPYIPIPWLKDNGELVTCGLTLSRNDFEQILRLDEKYFGES